MSDEQKLDGLLARVEKLEMHVQRLIRKASDLNSYFGNPLGIMNEESEIGPLATDERNLFYGEDDEEEEPTNDEEFVQLELRVVELESQVQQLGEVFRDLNDNLGSPVGRGSR